MTFIRTSVGASIAFVAFSANAHVKITSHTMRNSSGTIKRGPCGENPDARSTNIHTFLAGSTITLRWNEFVPHPGSFRIAFDDDGDEFPEPASYTDFFPATEPGTTIIEDNLFPHSSTADPDYTLDVQLPNIECDNCTLQLIQLMTDKAPYTVGGNDIYYNCLDIVLTKDNGKVPPPPPQFDFAGGSCSIQKPAYDTSSLWLSTVALVAGLFFISRKRTKK